MIDRWNEKAIRNEIARLDAKTGLEGAKLPIKFSNSKKTLGEYSSMNGGVFRFSNYYFRDSGWPEEEAIDVIRHEYAHYMDHMIYGKLGHGATWKHCCGIVGAFPIRCYDEKLAKYHQRRHEEEARLSVHYDSYHIGSHIEHPTYGIGVIKEITGESVSRRVNIDFPDTGLRTLSLAWVDKNCRRF